MKELAFFDRQQSYSVAWKTLPHWAQAGTLCFITWRTADSLPAAAVKRVVRQREEVLRCAGIAPNTDWKTALTKLPPSMRVRTQWSLFALCDRELDRNFGECVLRQSALSQIVEDSLLHFDGDRYVLTDSIVMPNHAHLLVAFRDEDALLMQCQSWKRYTARAIHQRLGRDGEFWQVEQFDHLVRGEEQFTYFREYIRTNPERARLKPGEYRWYSKPLS
jgi:REP element-mobilizing transposase RayT